MDSLIAAAARALSRGDPLAALQRVALRDDPPALALRGIAMAQLGELGSARSLLRRASRAFGDHEPLARARCTVAEVEVALAQRELPRRPGLRAAIAVLERHGDLANAWLARLVHVRELLLLGRVGEAALALGAIDPGRLPPAHAALARLARAEIAMRTSRAREAASAFEAAIEAARRSGIPALLAQAERARADLHLPAARDAHGAPLTLVDVERVLGSGDLVVDGLRRRVVRGERSISLARRPVLFALAEVLARGQEAPRGELIERAFAVRRWNETHRARLRVEIGRLRNALREVASIEATSGGFRLDPAARLLVPPIDGEPAALLALLAGGEAWSTSALALALGESQRSVQRALAGLHEAGRVRTLGSGRTRRWVAPPLVAFATALLLPTSA